MIAVAPPMLHEAFTLGITSLPAREVLGLTIENAATLPPNGQLYPLYDAFNNEWDRPAHFSCYQVLGTPMNAPVHRLRKEVEALPSLKGKIILTYVCIDWDLPKHPDGEKMKWSEIGDPSAPDRWMLYFRELAGPLGQWIHWCTSASGWHLTYVLASPLTPSMFESIAAGIRRDFHSMGIPVDERCSDWTHLYAFPKITKKSGMKTWTEPWFRDMWGPEGRTLDPREIRPEMVARGSMAFQAAVAAKPKDMPDADQAMAMIYNNGDRWKLTPLGARLKKKLEEALPYANEHAEAVRQLISPTGSFAPGMRDHAVAQTSGWVVNKLVAVEDASAEAIFGMFVPVCERTDFSAPREEGGSWLDKAWVKIHEWWSKDSTRLAEDIAMQKALASAARTKSGGIEGIAAALAARVTCEGLVDTTQQKALITKLAICMHGSSNFYALQDDGSYKGPFPTINSALGGLSIGIATELGFCYFKEKEGKLVQCWMPIPDILRISCARVTDATATFGQHVGRSRIVEILDGDMVRLETVSAGVVTQITPRWSDRVDRLMRVQTGCSLHDNSKITQQYREFAYWLAHAPLVDRWKLPALFLYGAPRSGKSLWCRAVSLLFTGNASGGHVLTQKWNLSLAHSALVAMDEGLPSLRGVAGRTATQMMRKVIVGDPIPVEGKGLEIRNAQMNWRIIASENSADSFYALMDSFGAFSAQDEKRALATRIHLIKVGQEAANWINANQNDLFPEDGSSNFMLEMAQHALFLSAQIEQHRETYFADIHSCRMGNLIQFPSTVTKDDAIEALSPSEHSAMVSLMSEIVDIAKPLSMGQPRKLDFCLDRFGNIVATRATIGEAAGKRDAIIRAGRPMTQEKNFVDLFSTPTEGDDGESRKVVSKQIYDMYTGLPIGNPIRRRWRKVEIGLLLRYLEDRDVPGLDQFIQRLESFRASRGLQTHE
jgi:hypothetical protein